MESKLADNSLIDPITPFFGLVKTSFPVYLIMVALAYIYITIYHQFSSPPPTFYLHYQWKQYIILQQLPPMRFLHSESSIGQTVMFDNDNGPSLSFQSPYTTISQAYTHMSHDHPSCPSPLYTPLFHIHFLSQDPITSYSYFQQSTTLYK